MPDEPTTDAAEILYHRYVKGRPEMEALLAKAIAEAGTELANRAATGDPFEVQFAATLSAVVYPEESGGYSAEVPALPGCFAEADTIEELHEQIREAAEGWLATKHDTESRRANLGG